MGEGNLSGATTTEMNSAVSNYNVGTQYTDGTNQVNPTIWDNRNFGTYYKYYLDHPELQAAVNTLGNWTIGKGYMSDSKTRTILNRISGAGEDTFESVMWNMIVIKKINGDSYSEIIRDDEGDIINIKPLSPHTMQVHYDEKGRIDHYEQISSIKGKPNRLLKPMQVLHCMNDRVADNIHGTSVLDACKWVIDARNEAMRDKRRVLHRNSIRILEVDADDTTTKNRLKAEWAEAIDKGEVIILPKGSANVPQVPELIHDSETWIKYLEDFFYTAVKVPKVVLGGSSEFTEASSKIALVTFDQAWHKEQADLEADLWNQCGILIKWNKPASLISEAITSEEKNTGQLGFQQNDVEAASGKTAVGE